MSTPTKTAVDDLASVHAFTRDWATAWNSRDGAAVAALCAGDLVYDEPALGDTVHGRQPIEDFVNHLAGAFPDYAFSLQGLYAEVSRPAVLVAWEFTGILAGTECTVRFHGDDRLEFDDDGQISAYRCLYDNDLVNKQIAAARQQ
ncbi:hypothetical protein TUM20985_56980 [Mycobacterium antarcticum]|uniref:nuclear transport factor 2 family protein n=1 Tax=Mycolicibacterium sp. TUM20985 TaxID=3023370 RepID=UPI002573A54D|nr:nuclear transport factor 2 family protein [Mycolicibacterium sp. TUM20985]BDX35151.1 hypothetical protein TUM20985_56980 [Mycolicibacterium sp. TUM20985]